MNNISQTTFSNVFSSLKMFEFRLKFHWNLFPMVQLIIFQHWFTIMAWRRSGNKPLSETMMVILLTHICVTRPQRVNTLRPRQNGLHFPYNIFKCTLLNENVWISINKANLRDLIAATGLVILLKLDLNRRFFSPCHLEISWMTPKNNRAPLLFYFKLFA